MSGVLDLAARVVHNEGRGAAKSLASGSNATSRIVISGREALGGGLTAGFHLEHGLLAQSGTLAATEKFWDRRATVSLGSAPWGELRAGRDLVPTYTSWSRHDPFSYVGVGRTANLVSATPNGPIRAAFGSNANTTVRADSAAQWLLPAGWGGLEGGILLAPGEGGLVTAGKAKVVAARLGYGTKVWNLTAATARSQNSQTTDGAFKDSTVGGSVAVGPARLSAAWREFKYSTSRQQLLLVGVSATLGLHELKASWTQSDMSGRVGTTAIDANDATQWALGYAYNLSKRTALYTTVSQLANEGAARLVVPDGPAGLAAGGTSSGYEVGLRHRF